MRKIFSRTLNATLSLVLVSGLMPVAANAQTAVSASEISGLTYETQSTLSAQEATWTTSGTCEWMIDADGTLTIRPANGAESGTLADWGTPETAVPWYSQYSSITSVEVKEGVSAQTCAYMFFNCSNLTSVDLSGLDTSKVTSMYYMFRGCSGLTSLDVSGLDTSNVANMRGMFYQCSGLTSLDVSHLNTSNVTDMGYMFANCSGLTSLDLSSFDTSNVTTMTYMFYRCSALTSLNLSSFDTSNVTDMSDMFAVCSGLTSLDVSSFDISKATTIKSMFYQCSSLTSLDLSSFDTSNVKDMFGVFRGCSKLTTIYANDIFSTDQVTSSDYMFTDCKSLVGGNGTEYSSSCIDKTRACIDTESSAGYFTSKKGSGDVNNNGVINIVDAQIAYDLAKTDAYKSRAGYGKMYADADVTGDGTVDSADSLAIQYYAMMDVWGA